MSHINALVNINGMPYLLGEYLDDRCWQQLNEYDVVNDITVDTSEAMRAIIDISLKDIPTNQDGSMYLIGNSALANILYGKINKYYNNYCGKLDTIRNTLKIKVNYQLENAHTGQIIRSTVEEFRLNQRNYFVKINVENTNDNPILSNFSNTIVSSITQFTHGRERMLLRITNIQLCYECVKPKPYGLRAGEMMRFSRSLEFPILDGTEDSIYEYHRRMQNSQLFPDDGLHREGPDIVDFNPPRWANTTAFYHFENRYNSLILHENEIYDRKIRVVEIPCGTINVNRSFYINPGHQLIFKFSIWKNDIAIINEPAKLAKALHIYNNEYTHDYPCDHEHNSHSHHHDQSSDLLYRMLDDRRDMDNKQNDAINKLNNIIVNNIYPVLKKLNDEVSDDNLPNIETLPVNENDNNDHDDQHNHHSPHHHNKKRIMELFNTVKSILIEIEQLKNKDGTTYQEIDDETLQEIIDNAVDSTKPDDI